MSELRELREDDAEAVSQLFATSFGGDRLVDAEEIRSWFRNTELRPEWLQVLEQDGRVVGYGDIQVEEDEVVLDMAAPGYWAAFFDWAEHEAASRRIARVRVNFPLGHELTDLATSRGYRLWRSSFTMEAPLDDGVTPVLPPGIRLGRYRPDTDTELLIAALNDAFAADPMWHTVTPSNFREYYLGARAFDPSLWFLAWDGADLAGFTLAYSERGGDRALGWIGTLGVRPQWRRAGLGEALLRAAFAALRARGLERVGLGVDTSNATGALRLYERVGMTAVRQADNWIRE